MARAKRKDAIANHERLLQAAFELLAERDPDLTVRELALRAEVGIGTAYRHFAEHDVLIRALYERSFEIIRAEMMQVPLSDDPWERLANIVEGLTFVLADNPGIRTVMRRMYDIDPEYRPAVELTAALGQLVNDAVDNGSLRPDTSVGDLVLTILALGSMVGRPAAKERAMLRRQVFILLDGLRADNATSELPPDRMDDVELHAFVHRANVPQGGGAQPAREHSSKNGR